MRILGIADHKNCGTALVVDGELISALNDERLVRQKLVFGMPRESIRAVLKAAQLDPVDIEGIAIATRNQHLIENYEGFVDGRIGLDRGRYKNFLVKVGSRISKARRFLPFLERSYFLIRQPAFYWRRRQLRRILRGEFGFDCPIFFLDHHYCHAASAYYFSGYRDATVVSIDAAGDGKSCRVYGVTNGEFDQIASISSFDSLAKLYSYVTQVCGFKGSRHEGKITGLAAYGEPKYVDQMRGIIAQQNGGYKNVGNVYYYSALKELKRVLPVDFAHKDLAASIQRHTADTVTALVSHWVNRTGYPDVALAGGVFANVRVNQEIHELDNVRSVFVYPAMSDEGLPAGGAIALHARLTGRPAGRELKPIPHLYLGPEYDETEIQSALRDQEVEADRFADVEAEVARLLARGAVVARFAGRMEYGPRALGNRSILYQTTDPTVGYWLNDALRRTEFMPFAPIVMSEYADVCFEGISGAEQPARFMAITFNCTDWMKKIAPGVVHVDGTARPQLIGELDNPSAYRILSEYHQITDIPCLINTSFNMHEEPIVCSPNDAVSAFLDGRLDYLAIGNWIAKHPNPIERQVDRERLDFYVERKGIVPQTA